MSYLNRYKVTLRISLLFDMLKGNKTKLVNAVPSSQDLCWSCSLRKIRDIQQQFASVRTNPLLLSFSLSPSSPPIRFKTNTNRVLVTRIFPRFKWQACFILRGQVHRYVTKEDQFLTFWVILSQKVTISTWSRYWKLFKFVRILKTLFSLSFALFASCVSRRVL